MAKLLPYLEVGQDPRNGQKFMLLSLSGARQLQEVLAEAIQIISEGLASEPEQPSDVCKLETTCGSVHVVFMTDNTLDKIMVLAKNLAGLPADFQPWAMTDGRPAPADIPDWLMQLGKDDLPLDGPSSNLYNDQHNLENDPED